MNSIGNHNLELKYSVRLYAPLQVNPCTPAWCTLLVNVDCVSITLTLFMATMPILTMPAFNYNDDNMVILKCISISLH